MASRIEPLMTVSELDACPDDGNRYELIEAELFVSRAPGIPHQRLVHNLEIGLTGQITSPILPGFQLKVRNL